MMGALGWLLKDGTTVSFEHALQIARKEGAFEKFPLPALAAMRETRHDGYWLSPSSATHCNRQRILKKDYDYYQDLEGSWTGLTGKAYHGILAEGARLHTGLHGSLQEERWRKVNLRVTLRDGTTVDFPMQGTPDLWDAETNSLYDWKTIGDFQYYDPQTKQRTNRVLPDLAHVIQINLYALFIRLNNLPVEHAYIWYVKSEGKKNVTRRLIEVELLDTEDAYHLACELAEPLAWAEKTRTLPQEVYDPSLYICQTCPVQAICRELHAKGE